MTSPSRSCKAVMDWVVTSPAEPESRQSLGTRSQAHQGQVGQLESPGPVAASVAAALIYTCSLECCTDALQPLGPLAALPVRRHG